MEPLTFEYKRVGGCSIRADVYDPSPRGSAKPVIVHIHGGALMMGNRKSPPMHLHDDLLADGYVVVSIDYRLAPETKLPGIIEDLQDAFKWVRKEGPARFNIDPERVGVTGNSAGGYLALMAGCAVTPRPKALVSFYGYGDLIGKWYSKPDPYYCSLDLVDEQEARRTVGQKPLTEETPGMSERWKFYLYCRQTGLWPFEASGFDPLKQKKEFAPYCPVQQVTPEFPPTLLLHGDADTDVPYEQSVMMAKELAKAGVEHEFITIPGGPHGFDARIEDPVVINALDRAREFVQRRV
jgi:acetyl esterase/lipase